MRAHRIKSLYFTARLLMLGAFLGLTANDSQSLTSSGPKANPHSSCRVAVLDGEVKAGEQFGRVFGENLSVVLAPSDSGWIVRVSPVRGLRGKDDYAELANPPYHSINPLMIGTEFGFRAQDALAWNPRHFRFAPDEASFSRLLKAYEAEESLSRSGGPLSMPERASRLRAVESELARRVAGTSEAELTITDAHLVQGTADQTARAATVASHWNASAHTIDQPSDGVATPLGRINWLRFHLRLSLPAGFRPAKGIKIETGKCI